MPEIVIAPLPALFARMPSFPASPFAPDVRRPLREIEMSPVPESIKARMPTPAALVAPVPEMVTDPEADLA
jgi:hypothetical protein